VQARTPSVKPKMASGDYIPPMSGMKPLIPAYLED